MKFHPPADCTANLSVGQLNALGMHSFLNILNIVFMKLGALAIDVANPEPLSTVMSAINVLAKAMRNNNLDAFSVGEMAKFQSRTLSALDAVDASESDPQAKTAIAKARAVLKEIFDVMAVRAQELGQRIRDPWATRVYTIDELNADFDQFFHAVEKNSSGLYGITHNVALQGERTYLIPFRIDSDCGDRIELPLLFKDVMRDIVANARKYTYPGGCVHVGIYNSGDKLRFTVQDNGIGIPPAELPKVFDYGYRATNVRDHVTMGGGFGLTKALYVTRQLGGDLWIES